MPIPRRWQKVAAIVPLLMLAFAGGCASPVPGGAKSLSGKRLIVSMTFNGTMNSQYYYYFLLNHYGPTGSQFARGPVPVVGPSDSIGGYGNGFATVSGGSTTPPTSTPNSPPDYGLTDYVIYNVAASPDGSGIGLYHINNDATINQPNGYTNLNTTSGPEPVSYNLGTPNGTNTISFQIDLAQLFPSSTATQTPIQQALALKYIQVNIIATNAVPISQTTDYNRFVCAAGNGTSGIDEFTTFVTLDLSNTTPVSFNNNQEVIDYNFNNVTSTVTSSLQLTNWSYQVTQVSQ